VKFQARNTDQAVVITTDRSLARKLRGIVLSCALLLSACASRAPYQVEELLRQALRAAETHHEFDQDPEAAVLLEAIHAVDPTFPGALELDEDLAAGARDGLERSLLGMNRRVRPPVERSPWVRALLWLPDRMLDLLDIVTVGVHLGPGAFADVHVTRALQTAGGMHTTGGVGLHDFRSLGMKSQAEVGLAAVFVGTHAYGGSLLGTSGSHAATAESIGLHRPMAPLYQELRDYWAVGASLTAGILGFEADLHPLQVADFLAGFAGVDFLNDDLARTRHLRLDSVEAKLLAELWSVQSSTKVLAAYREAREARLLSSGVPLAPLPDPARPGPTRAPEGSPAPAKLGPGP
jgi:hypothetical protein